MSYRQAAVQNAYPAGCINPRQRTPPAGWARINHGGLHVCVFMSASQDSESREPSNPSKAATSVWEEHQALNTSLHVASESTALSQTTSGKGRP